MQIIKYINKLNTTQMEENKYFMRSDPQKNISSVSLGTIHECVIFKCQLGFNLKLHIVITDVTHISVFVGHGLLQKHFL